MELLITDPILERAQQGHNFYNPIALAISERMGDDILVVVTPKKTHLASRTKAWTACNDNSDELVMWLQSWHNDRTIRNRKVFVNVFGPI